MPPTKEQRLERYKQANEHVQNAYGSEETGALLRDIFSASRLDERLYYEYSQVVGDVILGFYKVSDIQQLLIERVGIDASVATSVATALMGLFDENAEPISHTTSPEAEMQEEHTSEVPVTEEEIVDTNPTPRYARPLTDMPQYSDADPYREKLE